MCGQAASARKVTEKNVYLQDRNYEFTGMKRTIVLSVVPLLLSLLAVGCSRDKVLTEGLRYCESVLAYDGGLLIANFGSDELNPLNSEGKGYILYYDGSGMRTFIPADGTLSAPKGMNVTGGWLTVADVNKLVAFSLRDRSAEPVVIPMPEGEVFVNHIVTVDDMLLVSVTNTGNIYALDIDSVTGPDAASLELYTNVPGANGMLFDRGTLYVASYSPEGVPTGQNVIYRIADMANPVAEPVSSRTGQYDGLAMYGGKLYFTDWTDGFVGCMDVATGDIVRVETAAPLAGPAEIDVWDGRLCVPDLAGSAVHLIGL